MNYGDGDWSEFPWELNEERKHHVSWRRPDGGLMLMGGIGDQSRKTSEIVTLDGSIEGFNLKYKTL